MKTKSRKNTFPGNKIKIIQMNAFWENQIEKGTIARNCQFQSTLKSKNVNMINKYLYILNFILFAFILLCMPMIIFSSDHFIELFLGETGYQQIISEQFNGTRPSVVYVDEEVQMMRKGKVFIENITHLVRLEWDERISNMSYMFSNLTNITFANMNNITASKCDMSYLFLNCYKLEKVTSNKNNAAINAIGNMTGLFYNCYSLITFSFDNFSMNSDINMSYMFYNCKTLETISSTKAISSINDMKGMFYNCISLMEINLNNFKTKDSGVDLSFMFYNCQELNSFILTANAQFFAGNMERMFYNCISLDSIDLGNIKTTKSINVSGLFYNCTNLTEVKLIPSPNFLDTSEMFYNCISLTKINTNNELPINNNVNSNIIKVNMSKMFYNCKVLEQIKISGDSTYLFPNDFHLMFYNCISLLSLTLTNIKEHFIQDMSYMFYNCKKFITFSRTGYLSDASLTVGMRNMKGMFQNCESLISLDLSTNFFTKNVETMWDMFKGCASLISLNLNNFDTSQVTDMDSMFEGCYSLESLDISSFHTPKVQHMAKMFYNCFNLTSLNFSSIVSDSLANMHQMFYNCRSLEYLNLYSLTEKDQAITEIFEGASNSFKFCIKEKENIPNLFQEIFNMSGTSRECEISCYGVKNRAAIPEQHLCCPYKKHNDTCYDKCPSKTRDKNEDDICEFFTCSNDEYYDYVQNDCIKENSIPEGFFKNDTIVRTIDKCHDDCKTCVKKETDSNHTNCKSCKIEKPHIYLGNCYGECIKGTYLDEHNNEKCKCFDERCFTCTEESITNGKCTQCNIDHYRLYADRNAETFECFHELSNYYLKNEFFHPCYYSCETCNIEGDIHNHNCLTCNINNTFPIRKNGTYNCYPNCTNYYYFDENFDFHCTDDLKCPDEYDHLIVDLGECVKSCIETDFYQYEFLNKCYSYCPMDTVVSETRDHFCDLSCPFERPFMLVSKIICVSNCSIMDRRDRECVTHYFGNRSYSEIQDRILNDINSQLTNKKFNISLIKEGSIIINETDTIYEITTTKQKDSTLYTSSINFGECEESLKEQYFIPKEDELYILKMDNYLEGFKSPIVDYELYYPLGNAYILDVLDKTICEDLNIIISIPANLSGDPELYNKNSAYYNDLCVHYEFDDGYDMTLEDRQQNYIDNNMSICEEDCNFAGYDPNNGKADCSCGIKFSLPLVSEISIDKAKLYSFMNIKNIANFNVLKCYKLITSKVGIATNIGFYLFIPSFITYFVCLFLFKSKEHKQILVQIKNIAFAKKYEKYIPKIKKPPSTKYVQPIFLQVFNIILEQEEEINRRKATYNNDLNSIFGKSKSTFRKTTNKEVNTIPELEEEDNIYEQNNSNIKNTLKSSNSKATSEVKIKKANAPPIKGSNLAKSKVPKLGKRKVNFVDKTDNTSSSLNKIKVSKEGIFSLEEEGFLSKEDQEKIKEILKPNDNELNSLEYKQALVMDQRSFTQFYVSLLKTKHSLFAIFTKTDYNSRIVKIFLMVFNFCLSFAVNALFFSDETMHKILLDEGDFDLIYQLPQIIYSAIICFILQTMLEFLALSEDQVLRVKREKILRHLPKTVENVLGTLRVLFVSFFVISFVLLMLFWYYVTCFCAVYSNTQYHLIKDSIIGFGSSLLTPFAINVIPGFLRTFGLKNKKEYLYSISKLFHMF